MQSFLSNKSNTNKFNTGDIVRKLNGWTPMAIVGYYELAGRDELVYLADYCGDYFQGRTRFPSDEDYYNQHELCSSVDFIFVLVTNPEKEFSRCHDWGRRLSPEQELRLQNQSRRRLKQPQQDIRRNPVMKSPKELMNIAALTSDDLTTISVAFNADTARLMNLKCNVSYVFLCPTTLASQMTSGDSQVLCKTPQQLGVGTVVEVHKEVAMDHIEDYQYNWAFQIVDTDFWKRLIAWQTKVATQLSDAQRRATKRSALAALGIDQGDFLSLSDALQIKGDE